MTTPAYITRCVARLSSDERDEYAEILSDLRTQHREWLDLPEGVSSTELAERAMLGLGRRRKRPAGCRQKKKIEKSDTGL